MTTVKLDDQLCFALHAASRTLTAAYREPLGRLKLTYPQYLVLMVLWEDDDITVSSLGARLRLDSGTLSPLLKRLQVRGLVDRRPSADDARVVHVRLTDEGRTLADEADRISACVRDTVALSDDEIGLLRSLARRTAELDDLGRTS